MPAAASPSDAEIKTRGIARANEFCDAQGKRAVINVGQSGGWHLFSVQTAEVQFFCDDRLPPRPATSVVASAAWQRASSAASSAGAVPAHTSGERGLGSLSGPARRRRRDRRRARIGGTRAAAKIARPFD